MSNFFSTAASALPSSPLVWWRVSRPGAAICMVPVACRLQRAAPDDSDTAELIGRLLKIRFYGRRPATVDLLATSLLARALAGDAAAGVVVNHARRRRGLPAFVWSCDQRRFQPRPRRMDLQNRRFRSPSTWVAAGAP